MDGSHAHVALLPVDNSCEQVAALIGNGALQQGDIVFLLRVTIVLEQRVVGFAGSLGFVEKIVDQRIGGDGHLGLLGWRHDDFLRIGIEEDEVAASVEHIEAVLHGEHAARNLDVERPHQFPVDVERVLRELSPLAVSYVVVGRIRGFFHGEGGFGNRKLIGGKRLSVGIEAHAVQPGECHRRKTEPLFEHLHHGADPLRIGILYRKGADRILYVAHAIAHVAGSLLGERHDLLFGTLAKLLIDVDEQRDGRRQNGEHHHHGYDDEQHLAAMQFSIPRPHVFYSRSSP